VVDVAEDLSSDRKVKEDLDEAVENQDTKDEAKRKSKSFLSKLGGKITGKSSKEAVEDVKSKTVDLIEDAKSDIKQQSKDVKEETEKFENVIVKQAAKSLDDTSKTIEDRKEDLKAVANQSVEKTEDEATDVKKKTGGFLTKLGDLLIPSMSRSPDTNVDIPQEFGSPLASYKNVMVVSDWCTALGQNSYCI